MPGPPTIRPEAKIRSAKWLNIADVMISGQVGLQYPGTPIALSFLCLLVSIFVRATKYANRRRHGNTAPTKAVDGIVAISFVLFVTAVLWTTWTHR
jgi:hypothetical protein